MSWRERCRKMRRAAGGGCLLSARASVVTVRCCKSSKVLEQASDLRMQRCVEPEWLDELPPNDPRAKGSRRDLQRIHSWMGNVGIMARLLGNVAAGQENL